ncbi:MAG: hypothetical protein WCV80_03855 [Candidatus Paceibacterota bacterium]|jgi:hypothetical protein
MKKPLIIAIVVIVIAIAVWFVLAKRPEVLDGIKLNFGGSKTTDKAIEASTDASLGGQLFDSVKANPAESIPNTNPIQSDLNPYKGGYTNPF